MKWYIALPLTYITFKYPLKSACALTCSGLGFGGYVLIKLLKSDSYK